MNEELFRKYFDRMLTPADARQLALLLRTDAGARQEFARYAMEEGLFVEASGLVAKDLRQPNHVGVAFIDAQPAGNRLTIRRLSLPLAAAAALVLGVYGVNVWLAEKAVTGCVVDVKGAVARIQEAQGGIQDSGFRIQNGTQLRVGEIIEIGDAVRVGADGYMKFAYPDGSEIELLKNTQMALGAKRETRLFGLVQTCRGKWLKLDAGLLVAQVAKQKPGQAMVLTTPHAQVTVVGTKFSLEETTERTQLQVQEGVVRLADVAANKEIEVPGGYSAEAGLGVELKAEPMQPDQKIAPQSAERKSTGSRIEEGLLALYVFNEGQGAIIHDVSGVGEPADLIISNPGVIEWLKDGIRVKGGADIRFQHKPGKMVDSVKKSKPLTMEFWLRSPAGKEQPLATRPHVHTTFGAFDGTDRQLSAPHERGLLQHTVETHLVETNNFKGNKYTNGKLTESSNGFGAAESALNNMRFFYGSTLDNSWKGDCLMIAIYDRTFTVEDVERNYVAGLEGVERYRKADLEMGRRKQNP